MKKDNTSAPSRFLKEKLSKAIAVFPKIRIRYEFDIDANVHCIEVVPSDVYHSDSNYIKWKNSLRHEFIKKFPSQNVYFASDDAFVGVENIDAEFVGEDYVVSDNASTSIENVNTKFVGGDYQFRFAINANPIGGTSSAVGVDVHASSKFCPSDIPMAKKQIDSNVNSQLSVA